MDARQAKAVAGVLGGETWQSGGQIWLVLLRRADGRLVAISDDVVCEYKNEESLTGGTPDLVIRLR
jgi:hypothetical protein